MIDCYIRSNDSTHAFKCKDASMIAKSMATFILNEIPLMSKDHIGLSYAPILTREELDKRLEDLFNKIDHSDTKD